MARPRPAQLAQDAAVQGQALVWDPTADEWVPRGGFVTSYTWAISSTEPYLERRNASYAVMDRIRFGGIGSRTPISIKVICEVDAAGTLDILLYDVTNGNTIVEKTEIANTAWAIVDLGTLSNLSAGEAIWEVQMRTSSAAASGRLSSMDIKYWGAT